MINFGNFSKASRLFAFCRWRKKNVVNATATWGVVPCPMTVHYVYIVHYIYIKELAYGILLRQFPIYIPGEVSLYCIRHSLIWCQREIEREKKRDWELTSWSTTLAHRTKKSPRKHDEYWIRHLLCWFTISIYRPIRKYTCNVDILSCRRQFTQSKFMALYGCFVLFLNK